MISWFIHIVKEIFLLTDGSEKFIEKFGWQYLDMCIINTCGIFGAVFFIIFLRNFEKIGQLHQDLGEDTELNLDASVYNDDFVYFSSSTHKLTSNNTFKFRSKSLFENVTSSQDLNE